MGCTAYIVYTFHLSLNHVNLGQFKAKQVYMFLKQEKPKMDFILKERKTLGSAEGKICRKMSIFK